MVETLKREFNLDTNENNASGSLNGAPLVPPRRKHSGKMLKQKMAEQATLTSSNSTPLSPTSNQCNGLPPIPQVKVAYIVYYSFLVDVLVVNVLSFRWEPVWLKYSTSVRWLSTVRPRGFIRIPKTSSSCSALILASTR